MSDRKEGTPDFEGREDEFEDAGPDSSLGDNFQEIEEVLPEGGLRDDDIDLRSPETE